MSRTFKDSRAVKELRRNRAPDPIQRKYKSERERAKGALCDDDLCPDCGALTNFNNGFLTCTECNWSTFETEELDFFGLTFSPAI